MREARELQTLIDQLEAYIKEQDEAIKALQKTNEYLVAQLRQALAQPEPQVCCGDYEKCMKPCTPRGRWLANQQMTRLKQEKGQFVGGVPSVSQQREWVGLTDDEIDQIAAEVCFGYIDVARAIEAKLKERNT